MMNEYIIFLFGAIICMFIPIALIFLVFAWLINSNIGYFGRWLIMSFAVLTLMVMQFLILIFASNLYDKYCVESEYCPYCGAKMEVTE